MKKRIIIEVESNEDDEKIINFWKDWVDINFQKYKGAKIKVEGVKNEQI